MTERDRHRPARERRRTIAVAAAAAALALPAADAAATTGGAYSSAPAVVQTVACVRACLDEDTARAGSVVRLGGRSMSQVRRVSFLGARGAADDVTVAARRVRAGSVDARVPETARSGRVRLRNADGAPSRPSAEPVAIGLPEQPGRADRDTADRFDAQVDTGTVFFAGFRRAALRYEVTGAEPVELAIELVRTNDGASVARWTPGAVAPGTPQRVEWDGLAGGHPAPGGRYEFRVFSPTPTATAAQAGEVPQVADSFRFLDHKFPVRGTHDFGGAGARFGTARSGHSHQGHDVFAACGTPLVAARGGVVVFRASHARAGNYVVIRGDGNGIDYAYMHLQQPALVQRGARVRTGQRLGNVGDSGNARGCHLHFEMWSAPGWYEGGSPIDPFPHLRSWESQSATAARR